MKTRRSDLGKSYIEIIKYKQPKRKNKMWKFLNDSLLKFRGCFSRIAAFRHFAVVVLGLMLRGDHFGVTSIIRALGLNPSKYENIIHFFRAKSWAVESIRKVWITIVGKSGLVYRVHGMPVLVGDGVKTAKTGRKMPGVKKITKESESSAKPQYIHGSMFGGIGIVLGMVSKLFCTLLSMRMHDGNEIIGKLAGDELADESHIVRIISESGMIAKQLEPCILALDRAFLSVPMIQKVDDLAKETGKCLLSVVTRAKRNCIAYLDPRPKSGKGRKPLKGESVKIWDLFEGEAESFVKANVLMYGENKDVSYLTKDLLWGQGLYRKLRFVIVKYGNSRTVLVSTDLSLPAPEIIRVYALRFKIESSFRELKQVIYGFEYRFWTSAMPKLNLFAKNEVLREKLAAITDKADIEKIVSCFKATEGFAMLAIIALGFLQIIALKFGNVINGSPFRWLRTNRNIFPSEATTADFMRKTYFIGFCQNPRLAINQLIKTVQSDPFFPSDSDGGNFRGVA